MLDFKPVNFEMKRTVQNYTFKYGENSCQHSFVSSMLLYEKYGDMFCEKDNFLYTLRSKKSNDIYRIYLEELHSNFRIDFDMMIDNASLVVEKYGMKKYYKYIIVDEFQDTSIVRYKLIKSIIDECDSKLLCVGDDFQSIYKFSGCTMDLFVNFKKYFLDGKVLYMNKTYRNSLELVRIAYHFIIKNPYQLSKFLVCR